jgi:hypothetical protein
MQGIFLCLVYHRESIDITHFPYDTPHKNIPCIRHNSIDYINRLHSPFDCMEKY